MVSLVSVSSVAIAQETYLGNSLGSLDVSSCNPSFPSTITGAVGAQTLTGCEDVTISSAGSISDSGVAVTMNNGRNTISNNSGSITSLFDVAIVLNGNSNTINNNDSGEIKSDDSIAIDINDDNNTINNSGSATIMAINSAIVIDGDNNVINNTDTGTITGEFAFSGTISVNGSENIINNSATITSTLAGPAIFFFQSKNNEVNNTGGTISSSNDRTILVDGGENIAINNTGSTISSKGGAGIEVINNSENVSIINNDMITVSSFAPAIVFFDSTGIIENNQGATIESTSGGGGINATNGSLTINNHGFITAISETIILDGTGEYIVNNHSGATIQSDNTGLLLPSTSGNFTINNDGAILGTFGFGIFASGPGKLKLTNGGTIEGGEFGVGVFTSSSSETYEIINKAGGTITGGTYAFWDLNFIKGAETTNKGTMEGGTQAAVGLWAKQGIFLNGGLIENKESGIAISLANSGLNVTNEASGTINGTVRLLKGFGTDPNDITFNNSGNIPGGSPAFDATDSFSNFTLISDSGIIGGGGTAIDLFAGTSNMTFRGDAIVNGDINYEGAITQEDSAKILSIITGGGASDVFTANATIVTGNTFDSVETININNNSKLFAIGDESSPDILTKNDSDININSGSSFIIGLNEINLNGDLNVSAGTTLSFDLKGSSSGLIKTDFGNVDLATAGIIKANLLDFPILIVGDTQEYLVIDSSDSGNGITDNSSFDAPDNNLFDFSKELRTDLITDDNLFILATYNGLQGLGEGLEFLNTLIPEEPDLFDVLLNLPQDKVNDFIDELNADPIDNFDQATILSEVITPRMDKLRGFSYGDSVNSSKNNLWGQAVFINVDQDLYKGVDGFNAYINGVVVGYDRMLDGTNVHLGGAAGYIHGNIKSESLARNFIETESIQVSAYGRYTVKDYYVDGILIAGFDNYDRERGSSFGLGTAVSDYDGFFGLSRFGGGYNIIQDHNLTISPTMYVEYAYVSTEDSDESGALINYHVDGDEDSSLKSDIGLKLTYQVSGKLGLFQPVIYGSWIHDYLSPNVNTNASVIHPTVSTSTVFIGPASPRNSYVFGLNLEHEYENVRVRLGYKNQWQTKRLSQTAFINVNYSF